MEEHEQTKPQVAEMKPPRQPSPDAQRKARQLLWVAVILGAGVAGFCYSLYFLGPSSSVEQRPGQAGAALQDRQQLPVAEDKPAVSVSPLPDPASPPPATTEALVEELNQVTGSLVQSFPNSPDALEVMGRAQLWRGNTDEAVKSWEKCLTLKPGYAYAYRGLGSVAAKKGDYEKAVTMFRRALLFAPTSPEIQTELADALTNLGKLEEAITMLEENVKTDLRPWRGFVLLGMAYLQRKDYQKAKESYEKAIAAHPKHANAHFGLATVYARLGLKEKSREYMEKFKELRAGEREIRTLKRNQYDDQSAIRGEVAGTYTDAGRVYLAYGRLQEAERLWRRAATLHPTDVNCRQALASLYLRQGKIPQTIGMLEQLAEIEPENVGYPLEIGRLHAQSNQLEAAEKAFRSACERAPKDPAGYVAIAQLYLNTPAELQKALTAAQTAVELEASAANYVLLSAVRERMGDIEDAVEAMQQAVDLERNNLQYRQMYELLKEKMK